MLVSTSLFFIPIFALDFTYYLKKHRAHEIQKNTPQTKRRIING